MLDLFVTHWTQYDPQRRDGRVVQKVPVSCIQLEEDIARFLNRKRFRRIPDRIYDTHVPNVTLELSEPSDVTVGKCLFDDYDG